MPLPTLTTPTYELKLPSTGKKIKYRPFLVKEEKILIIALETRDQNEMTNTSNIINRIDRLIVKNAWKGYMSLAGAPL